MIERLKCIARNPHTSGAAVAILAAYFGIPVLAAWFPGHDSQFHATTEAIKSFAFAYGLIFAADAKPAPAQNGNAGADIPAQQEPQK